MNVPPRTATDAHSVFTAQTSDAPPLRVFIAEDQFLLREGLTQLLLSYGFDVVGAVANGGDIEPELALLP